MTSQKTCLVAPPTQTLDVHSVKSTNPKATQQPNKKKKNQKKGKGDKKPTNNARGGNTKKNNLKYMCNLFMEDHPNNLFPHLAEA
jgi:ribosomal protein L44E